MPLAKPMPFPSLRPEWPAPVRVHALTTVREGGVSSGRWRGLNLADHVGDDPRRVAVNRERLIAELGLTGSPQWLMQEHGVQVIEAKAGGQILRADASYSRESGVVCAVLTADCLPVLLCDETGTVVAAAHAGWRGLAAGVLTATVAAMAVPADSLLAWLGPAIGPAHFEVGGEVKMAFESSLDNEADRSAIAACFTPSPLRAQHYYGDLYQLARCLLARLGATRVYGGDYCTYGDVDRFYSYRRDGVTGRMASLIWFDSL